MAKEITRRNFVSKTVAGLAGVAASTGVSGMKAASYKRIVGANDRVNLAFLGCGDRSKGHQIMVRNSVKDKNLGVVAVCDIWSKNREETAARCETMFGNKVKEFKYSEDLLSMPDLDGVMIGTGDFQHAKLMEEVVKAGKDCYVEKPLAQSVEEAKMAREVVLSSKQVVQNGSQWLSDPIQRKVRDIVRSGKLGQITKMLRELRAWVKDVNASVPTVLNTK